MGECFDRVWQTGRPSLGSGVRETLTPCSLPQWISGAGDPRNAIHILIGLSDPENPNPHKRFTIVLIPADHPSVKVVRPMQVFGYDDAPEGHCEVLYDNVRLNEKECLVGGWGRGFEVS